MVSTVPKGRTRMVSTVPKGRTRIGSTVPKDAPVGLHSPEGTQAFSRQPGLAVPGTIDSESSEGAQAENASPTAPSTKTIPPRTLPARHPLTQARTHWQKRSLKIVWQSEMGNLKRQSEMRPAARAPSTPKPPPSSSATKTIPLPSPEGHTPPSFASPQTTRASLEKPPPQIPDSPKPTPR